MWEDETPVDELAPECDIHPSLANLFLMRQLGTASELELKATSDGVWHDPYLFSDMEKTVLRIKAAISEGQSILVYGDYDADGTTATAVLVKALRDLGGDAHFYIPHRFYEGYGPNMDAFSNAIGEGHELIISVDCGISALEEAELLKEQGVDFIIIDHHHPKEELPAAFAIIHPELDENYPFDFLAGAGVTLKVVEALKEGELDDEDYMLAMFGTVGDVVTLTDENRTLVKRGLNALKTTTSYGTIALLNCAEVTPYDADETTVGYRICPRLNAPGRMDDASLVVELLLATNEEIAKAYAREIEALNDERKAVTEVITAAATGQATEKIKSGKKAVVLYDSQWHEGVLGIVAAKIMDNFGVVVIVLTDSDEGLPKGSARAPQGFDLLGGLEKNATYLEKFGGHQMAAGMTLNTTDIEAFEMGLNEALADGQSVKKQAYHVNIGIAELDLKWANDLSVLAPFGQGNPRPVVRLTEVAVTQAKRIGANHDHLKLCLVKEKTQIDAIFFNSAHIFAYLTPEATFDVLCEIDINVWNGNRKLQARIIDIKSDTVQIIDLRNQKKGAEFGDSIASAFEVSAEFETKEALKAAYKASTLKNIVLKPLGPMSMPSRAQFANVYQIINKHAPFSLTTEVLNYFKGQQISQGMLAFIVRVFVETGLITYADGVINQTEATEKVDMSAAPSYISRQNKANLHEFLELATADELLTYLTT